MAGSLISLDNCDDTPLCCAGEMTYVNLQLNPERYTGYTGPSARRIWDAVYSENCPKCECFSISLYHVCLFGTSEILKN